MTAPTEKSDVRVAAGYKATLARDTASEEAKKKARRMLRQMGIEYDEPPPKKWASRKGDTNSKSGGSNGSMSKKSRSTADDVDNEPEEKRRAAGYKATLNNSRTSPEAKKKARAWLEEHDYEYD